MFKTRNGKIATAVLLIMVLPLFLSATPVSANSPPVITGPADFSVLMGEQIEVEWTATDNDPDFFLMSLRDPDLTFVVADSGAWTTSPQTFSINETATKAGVWRAGLTATDFIGQSTSDSVFITVTNPAPVVLEPANSSVALGDLINVTFTISDNDPFNYEYRLQRPDASTATQDVGVSWTVSPLEVSISFISDQTGLWIARIRAADSIQTTLGFAYITVLDPAAPPEILNVDMSASSVTITFDDPQGCETLALAKVRLYQTNQYTAAEAALADPNGHHLVEFSYDVASATASVDQGESFGRWSITSVVVDGCSVTFNYQFAQGNKASNGLKNWLALGFVEDAGGLDSGWVDSGTGALLPTEEE